MSAEATEHRPPFEPATPDATARFAAARDAVIALPRRREQLLPAFLVAQAVLGWLPREAIALVAEHVRVPVSEVYTTATAYSELHLDPPQSDAWRVCTGVACDLAGAASLREALAARLPGRVHATDCQFLCALAPVAVDPAGRLRGRMAPDSAADDRTCP